MSPILGIGNAFGMLKNRYGEHFHTSFRDVSDVAGKYLQGLFQSSKKNMERMEEVVPGSDPQALHHFISNSPWNEKPLLMQIGNDANHLLGNSLNSCLLIDETGFVKKGNHSAGVSRQWCGQVGKVENSQVGVFSVICNGKHATAVDYRLYLPESWLDSVDWQKRCNDGKIPSEYQVYKSKRELALELVESARANGMGFNWIGADGFYGMESSFLYKLEAMGESFMIDVHKDRIVYLEDPAPQVPETKPGHLGRHFSRLKPQVEGEKVCDWVNEQPESAWRRVEVRASSKGKLKVDILHKRVWIWDSDLQESEAHLWHLVVRREVNSPHKIKYSLSNAPQETSLHRLAFMQAQRYWVERSFQNGKSQCGMGDYQVRSWVGWHHHMAMVLLAMLLMMEQYWLHRGSIPLLSYRDIVILLVATLQKRDIMPQEIMRQLRKRHRKRLSAIKSHKKRQMEVV